MTKKYYIDANIWIDFFHERQGYCGELLSSHAYDKNKLVISNVLISELKKYFSQEEIINIFIFKLI